MEETRISFPQKILNAFLVGHFLQRVINKIDSVTGIFVRTLWSKTGKVQNNKIAFMTYDNNYICNPKYIAEELLKTPKKYDIVWLCSRKNQNLFPKGIRTVVRNSIEGYVEMRSAKLWIDNAVNFTWVPFSKKKSQVYINTWHGSMGLKRIGKDDNKNRRWVKCAAKCGKETTFCISNSQFENDVFRETYWPKTEILMYGHARNDILLCKDKEKVDLIKKKVFDFFEFEEDCKLLLYAPTFRDYGDTSVYDIDFALLKSCLVERFGGDWKILYRRHFHTKTSNIKVRFNDYLFDASEYDDMQELMLVAAIGISDYSSWLCDFVLTRKPAFIYASDIVAYESERSFYYPLETTPFPIATNNDELINNIINFDNELYLKKCEEFLKDKGCVEDGHAAERVVEKINEIIWGGGGNNITLIPPPFSCAA